MRNTSGNSRSSLDRTAGIWSARRTCTCGQSRRRLHATPEHGYTDADPWNAVMAQSIKEDGFWTKEVVTPATLRLAQAKSIPAPLSPQRTPGAQADADRDRGQPKRKKRKAKETEDKSRHNGQVYTHNRRGLEIWANWNQGRCGKPLPQSACENKRSHQCNLCLGPYPATGCKNPK